MRMIQSRSAFVLVTAAMASAAFSQTAINIVPNASLSGNAPALAAFNRAANAWASRFSDPITITINAGLAGLGSGVIGSTSNVTLAAGFNTIRNAMVTDAANEALTNSIVASLPTSATFSAFVPSGFGISSNMAISKANAKALGFAGLDASFGASDGTITFSSNFGFDFDNSNGVGAGLMDFETVALHEIGHLLGFVSVVDDVDFGLATGQRFALSPTPLDLFRFQNNVAGRDPSNSAEFATFPRSFMTSGDSIFDDTGSEQRFSTGVSTGDGNQASHWKADDITGVNIGIMDPTLDFGVKFGAKYADLRAFDLIGYDLKAVPEPSTFAALALGGLAVLRRRKKA